MSMGYLDPITKKYVKRAGNNGSLVTPPIADENTPGLMSPEDRKVVDSAYTTDDIASKELIRELFVKSN